MSTEKERTHHLGTIFNFNGSYYILARIIDLKYNLISLSSGGHKTDTWTCRAASAKIVIPERTWLYNSPPEIVRVPTSELTNKLNCDEIHDTKNLNSRIVSLIKENKPL
jgi:hypothetical protein